jgi:hypothetical protein
MNFIVLSCFSLFSLWMCNIGALAQDRVALVIGVANYTSVQPLKNSVNDAKDMAALLKAKEFKIVELYDPKTKKELKEAIRVYFELLRDKPNATGLLYYSGHGIQVDGSNYFIPTTANPQIKADLDEECIKADYILQALEQAGNQLNIIIFDACRNNPFRSFTRSGEKGLSIVDAPKGSYIVYSTKPGSVASDGEGRNGLFTSKLLKVLESPNLSLEQVFKRVAAEVATESGESQRPWIASDYTGEFYFTTSNNVISQKIEISQPSKSTSKEAINEAIEAAFNANFKSYKTGKDSITINATEWEQDFKKRAAGLQEEYKQYERDVANLTIGQAKAVEEGLARMQNNLRLYQESVSAQIKSEEEEVIRVMEEQVSTFLLSYGKKRNLKTEEFALSTDALFGGEELLITNMVIKKIVKKYEEANKIK